MSAHISNDELIAALAGPRPPALVEALGHAYFDDAHLPGAVNIPVDQVDRLAPDLLPDPKAQIVVYCSRTCSNSDAVAQRLEALGYQHVMVYAAGKEDWVERGLPVERADTRGARGSTDRAGRP